MQGSGSLQSTELSFLTEPLQRPTFIFFIFFVFFFFFFFSGLLERQSRQHIKFSDHPTLNHTFSALDRIDDGA